MPYPDEAVREERRRAQRRAELRRSRRRNATLRFGALCAMLGSLVTIILIWRA